MQQNVLVFIGFGHASQFDFRTGFGRQNDIADLNASNVIKYFSGFVAEASSNARIAFQAAAPVPAVFSVEQNYPNPFNPETSIRYNLSQTAPVRVEIFDQLGRKVRTLVNGEMQQQGYHSKLWDGRDDSGRGVATGIYIYKVTAGKESIAKKMVLQK